MSFLAPLFLAGALAVGLPILFHFIRRTTRERKLFGSLMFLSVSPPRLTRRTRLEHLLLLALRCAVICLLALGFARPFFRQSVAAPDSRAGKRVLLLVDVSASMRRADLWSDARKKVDSILRSCTAADQVALFTFDRQVHPQLGFEQWNAAPVGQRAVLVSSLMAKSSPGWGSTQLGNALVQAAEALADNTGKLGGQHSRIELITDLQEGSRLEQLQGYEWPKGVEVSLNLLKPRSTSNASLELVSDSEEVPDVKAAAPVRVRLSNAAGSKHEQFKVGWSAPETSGFTGAPQEVYVPAGQSRVFAVLAPPIASVDRIVLQGDDEPFDNVVFASPPEALRLKVTYLGAESEADTKAPLYFLKRAFQETRHEAVSVMAHKPAEPLGASQLQESSLIVVGAAVPEALTAAMREQAASGKTVLVMLNTAEMQSTVRGLLQNEQITVEEVHPATYALLGEIDFRDQIFAPFADPRFSDFTKIHFWKYERLDAGQVPRARALARFDSGDPALLEVPFGAGRILVLTSGWQPESSQLALSSKFVPLLYAILESSGVPEPLPAQYRVGDLVPLGQLAGSLGNAVLRVPDGSQVTLAAGQTNFSQTTLPGVYTLSTDRGAKKFVVNLDPAESRTAPLPMDELERLGVPASRPVEAVEQQARRQAQLQSAEIENRQKLWRWLVAGTLLVLIIETWLAGRTARGTTTPAGTVAA